MQNGVGRVHVACDHTDAFVVLRYNFWKLIITTADITVLPTYSSHNVVAIKKIMESNIDLILSLLAAHALSGCDTTGRYYGIAKGTVVKQLKKACNFCNLGTLKVI